MPIPLRVLLVEDSEDDTLLLLRELRRGDYEPSVLRVDTADAMIHALCEQEWDLILCDYAMPHFNGLEALRLYRECEHDIPFIVVSGTIGEDVAVNTMLAGAHDYIMKGRLSRLIPAIQRELREAQERRARKDAEAALEEYRNHLEELVKQRTAELNAANEYLQELSRIKDEFVSNVTHELRTPITSLKLHQYLILADAENSDEHLAVIKRETDRLATIIDALLHLSRLDQGRVPFDPVPVNLNQLAAQYVADRTPLAERKALSLQFEGALISPVVLADERLLGQALSILLTNALNYTPGGGLVTISTATRAADGRIWAALAVSDTGPGISPDEQPHLFERFFRGKVGLASGAPGTGLGLALAKEIIDLHQGRIRVANVPQPATGATFSIELPVGS
jgi:signal transduction histidine kinase